MHDTNWEYVRVDRKVKLWAAFLPGDFANFFYVESHFQAIVGPGIRKHRFYLKPFRKDFIWEVALIMILDMRLQDRKIV